jgi:hypothetical protein
MEPLEMTINNFQLAAEAHKRQAHSSSRVNRFKWIHRAIRLVFRTK